MTESTYDVAGMACGHCVGLITDEVERVAGVTAVVIDLAAGRMTVVGDREIDPAAVRAAVEEAGCEVGPPVRRTDATDPGAAAG